MAGDARYVLLEMRIDPSAKSGVTRQGAQDTLFGTAGGWTREEGTDNLVGHAPKPGSQAYVRRPMRGISLKRETFATLSVTAGSLLNSSAKPGEEDRINFTSNFLLQSVREDRQEKFQAVTTFGAPYGYFFGEQPRMVSCQAILLNTADFQWEAEWWENYDKNLRGTRLVDRGARVQLVYEDVLLEGYLVAAGTSKSEPTPWAVTLSFTMWVTNVVYLINVGAKKIDLLHEPNMFDSEFGEFTSDQILSEAAQASNVKKLSGAAGLVSAVRRSVAGLQGFTGEVGTQIASAVDWLYGRNMVTPPNNPRTEIQSPTGTFTVTAPVRVSASTGLFYDNADEYPTRYVEVPHFPLNTTDTADTRQAVASALDENFGKGKKTGEVLRLLGSASFAAVSYVASGATSQDAAALLANAGHAVLDQRIADPFNTDTVLLPDQPANPFL